MENKRKGGETLDYMDEIQELIQMVSTLDLILKEMKKKMEKIINHCYIIDELYETKDRETQIHKEENA